MKTRKLLELERERLGLMEEARTALAEFDSAKNDKEYRELEKRHDAILRKLDYNKIALDEAHLEARENEDRDNEMLTKRPSMGAAVAYGADAGGGDIGRAWAGENRSGWADQQGNPVYVLSNRERLSEERHTGVGLGDTVRAMITGARNDLERRALSEGTSSAGGYTVPAPLATWFIDKLRAQSVAVQAGAMTVPMSSETLAIAKLTGDPTIGWRAENASIAEGDPTFGRVLLSAKSLAGIVKISRELMMDTVNAGAIIEQALAKTMALEIDRAAIYGDGSSNSPTGIYNTAGVNSVSMATNGAALANNTDKLLDAVYEMLLDNAGEPSALIWHPRTAVAAAKLKDGQGQPFVWPEMIARIPKLMTTAAPITETQGTASTASSIVFGDFSKLFIGMREQINIRLLDQLYAAEGQIALLVHARVDMQLSHAESFSLLKGIIP